MGRVGLLLPFLGDCLSLLVLCGKCNYIYQEHRRLRGCFIVIQDGEGEGEKGRGRRREGGVGRGLECIAISPVYKQPQPRIYSQMTDVVSFWGR